MHQFCRFLIGSAAAAVILAVPAFAVCVFASSSATQTVAIAPGDDPMANRLSKFTQAPAKPASQSRRTKVGETTAEVQAQEWVATGGGGGPGGSPKG